MPRDEEIVSWIREHAQSGRVLVTQHAAQEMVEEDIHLDDVLAVLGTGRMLENYPEHRRGSCALIYGLTGDGRPLHVVCTTRGAHLVIITVYEPQAPKWVTPTRRRPPE